MRLAVFASGSGSNLQALIDHFAHDPRAEVKLVVSDRAGSGALARARAAGIATAHMPVRDRDAGELARDTLEVLSEQHIDFIALAGYLRLVPADIVAAYPQRLVNIHPALLPAFGGPGMYGMHVHRAVLAAGCTVTGATVHYVDDRYDEGRIIAQWPVPVLADDTAERLAARVLQVEHRLYPTTVAALAGRITADADAHQHTVPSTSGAGPAGEHTFRLGVSLDDIEDEITALADL